MKLRTDEHKRSTRTSWCKPYYLEGNDVSIYTSTNKFDEKEVALLTKCKHCGADTILTLEIS